MLKLEGLKKSDSHSSSVKRFLDPNEVLGEYPNAASRKFLAEKWQTLSLEEQTVLRATRSKRGIKCFVCNTPGYFRENCPNGCLSPPPTPNSDDSDVVSDGESKKTSNHGSSLSGGLFWGKSEENEDDQLTSYKLKRKLDFHQLRKESTTQKVNLRNEDEEVQTHEFFTQASENYARNAAELTLHQLMRRIMRLVEKQLLKNAENLESTFDTTLLVPPSKVEGKNFYPDEFMKIKEYRDYFMKKLSKKGIKKAHQNQSSLRTSDELDPLFRGESTNTDFLYRTNPKAGESIHAKNTWKSVFGRYDVLANSDPSLAAKQKKLDMVFHTQNGWIRSQSKSMEFCNDRFEHLVFILRHELEHEHERESKVLLAEEHGQKDAAVDVWQERMQSVDLITKVLQTYSFTAGVEEADFLLFCLRSWQDILQKKKVLGVRESQIRKTASRSRHRHDQVSSSGAQKDGDNREGDADADADADNENDSDDMQSKKTHKSKQRKGKKSGARDLVAATNPYNSDLEFLETMKRKQRRIYEKGKIAVAFTAQRQRQLDAEKEKQRNQRLKDIEESTAVVRPHLQQSEIDSGQKDSSTIQQLDSPDDDEDSPSRSRRHLPASSDEIARTSISSPARKPKGSPKKDVIALPSMDEIMAMATEHTQKVDEREERLKKHQAMALARLAPKENFTVQPFIHPREQDARRIAKRKAAFKHAGLGNRIREGKDDDHAHALPALIPIPRAFDGDSQVVSHTATNIIYGLKKSMVLSDLGYSPQTVVPLYVRTTLVEKEGTSLDGDPTQEELGLDRRYSHYLGRPMIRFNDVRSASASTSTVVIQKGQVGTTSDDRDDLSEVSNSHSRAHSYSSGHDHSYSSSYGLQNGHDHGHRRVHDYKHTSAMTEGQSPVFLADDLSALHFDEYPAASQFTAALAPKSHPRLYLPPRDPHQHYIAPLEHNGRSQSQPVDNSAAARWNRLSTSPVRTSATQNIEKSPNLAPSTRMHTKVSNEIDAGASAQDEVVVKKPLSSKDKKLLKLEKKYNPLTRSLVRLVFKNPQPGLDELQFLDENF